MAKSKWLTGKSWIVAVVLFGAVSFSPTIAVYADAPKIGGFLDTTYNYNFNRPLSRTTAGRSYDFRTDSFLLNNAQVSAEGTFKEGEAGYRVELDFGTDASVHKSGGTGADTGVPGAATDARYNFDVQEAYLTYKCPKTAIQLKMGKFVTFNGIEVIESKDNYTITRGFLFGLAEPYTHVGGLIGYALPKYLDVWVGVVNGWDRHVDNNSGKTFLAKLGLTPMEGKVWGVLSLSHGAEKNNNTNDARTTFDSTWFIKPMDMLTIALQQNIGEEDRSSVHPDRLGGAAHWYGIGISPKVDVNKMFGVGVRYEWFSDLDGARTPAAVPLIGQNLTLAPTFNCSENLMFRVEYRYDWTTVSVYEVSDGRFSNSHASTVSTEFIYKF